MGNLEARPQSSVGIAFDSMSESHVRSPEFLRLNEAVTAVNVERLMPVEWKRNIKDIVKSHGKLVTFQGGKVSTSMETEQFTTAYTVVKGDEIAIGLPWFMKLYHNEFRDLVSDVAGVPVVVDKNLKFGFNINKITKATQRHGYELHTDINPYTALLAATSIRKGDGGELIHILPSGKEEITRIRAGWLYIFDGRTHPHKVKQLNPRGMNDTRITVLMDYMYVGWDQKRPEDLEAIFGNGNSEHGIENDLTKIAA